MLSFRSLHHICVHFVFAASAQTPIEESIIISKVNAKS